MRLILAAWLLMSAGVFAITRLGRAGNSAAVRPLAAVTGLVACFVIWRLYRLGWDPASVPAVPERTRRQARWLMWTLVAAGVLGSAWEIVRGSSLIPVARLTSDLVTAQCPATSAGDPLSWGRGKG